MEVRFVERVDRAQHRVVIDHALQHRAQPVRVQVSGQQIRHHHGAVVVPGAELLGEPSRSCAWDRHAGLVVGGGKSGTAGC
ncbi:hypothetical protein M878_44755 [Streptomyces roseochromogenus subsp. oscitans DS 12.976]|uniref:Uncharacterized protein n=1 Tax=Streptomyces roseochromogenus subsp. oscitans DS 12.976 TaxID=1352936 RepID=V6JH05_STRRC|nr:hypothetical protein M878_44755 [Streptomyces roseochromogenus subsp. oscitans DS 12.976]